MFKSQSISFAELVANVTQSSLTDILVDAGKQLCKNLCSSAEWSRFLAEQGKFFAEYEKGSGQRNYDLSVILSEKNMDPLAAKLKNESGYTIKDCALSYLNALFDKYEIPHDVAGFLSDSLLNVILDELRRLVPGEYDRYFQNQWKEQNEKQLRLISERLEELYDTVQSFRNQEIDVSTAQDKDLELKHSTENPQIGISFFVIDDTDFQEKFEQQRFDECINIRSRCREEAIYCIINELWRLRDERSILIVRSEESWKKLSLVPSSDKVYIPWFYADEINPIPGNSTIFVYTADMPSFKKDVLELRPRTYKTLENQLLLAGLKYQEASRMLKSTHGLYIPMKRKMIKGQYRNDPRWLNLPDVVIKTCLLVSQWTNCDGDQEIIEELSGLAYNDFMTQVLRYEKDEEPLIYRVRIQNETVYCLASTENTWERISISFDDSLWEKFEELFLEVVVEAENLLICSWEDRIWSRLHGETLFWSSYIRNGMTRSLIMKAFYKKDESCQEYMDALVEKILASVSSSDQWKYISAFFKDLCEISPKVVINRLNQEFTSPTGLWELFENQSKDFILGKNEYINILFGVEILLSMKEYVMDAVEWLLRLDNRSYEYKANTPQSILGKVLCPWKNFSALMKWEDKVSVAKRAFTIDSNSWNLFFDIIPYTRNMIVGGLCRPQYRVFEREGSVCTDEILNTEEKYQELLLQHMELNPDRWIKLLKESAHISEEQRNELFSKLLSETVKMPDMDIILIKNAVREFIFNHRYFCSSDWELSETVLDQYEEILNSIRNREPEYEYVYLSSLREEHVLLHPVSNDIKESHRKNRTAAETHIRTHLLEFRDKGLDLGKLASICGRMEHNKLGNYLGSVWSEGRFDDVVFRTLINAQASGRLALDYFQKTALDETNTFDKALKSMEELGCERKLIMQLYAVEAYCNSTGELAVFHAEEDIKSLFWKSYTPVIICDNYQKALEECLKYGTCESYLPLLYDVNDKLHLSLQNLFEWFIRVYDLPRCMSDGPIDFYLKELLKLLQNEYMDDSEKCFVLRNIELFFYGDLRWEDMRCFLSEMKRSPKLYAKMILFRYIKSSSQDDDQENEGTRRSNGLEYVFDLLNNVHFCPCEENNTVSEKKLKAWVEEFDELLAVSGDDSLSDLYLGRLFSFSPLGEDGHMPCEAVREIIEERASDDLNRKYKVSLFNQRGVFSPSDGKGERRIAETYRENADYLNARWPRTARIYYELADTYSHDAEKERQEAESGLMFV